MRRVLRPISDGVLLPGCLPLPDKPFHIRLPAVAFSLQAEALVMWNSRL